MPSSALEVACISVPLRPDDQELFSAAAPTVGREVELIEL